MKQAAQYKLRINNSNVQTVTVGFLLSISDFSIFVMVYIFFSSYFLIMYLKVEFMISSGYQVDNYIYILISAGKHKSDIPYFDFENVINNTKFSLKSVKENKS